MKSLTPIILILISIGVFFIIIDPQYKKVQALDETITENDKMLVLADQLRSEREKLQAKFNNIGGEDKEKLQKVLPDAVDNVRLILDINNIAESFGIVISNIGVDGEEASTGGGEENDNRVIDDSVGNRYGTISLSFSVSSTYDNFKAFMNRLEDSLRLVDVVEFTVRTTGQTGVYQYSVKLDTYWLR